MALPKLDIPTFTTKLLSNGKKITYRPFLVKEEKILFMALESDSSVEMTRAMKQIINNCVQDDIDIDDLPLFDIEYMDWKSAGKMNKSGSFDFSVRKSKSGKCNLMFIKKFLLFFIKLGLMAA